MTTIVYASVGPKLTRYDIDVEAATLTARESVEVAANVQYVWPHASRRFLYVASSDSAAGMGPIGTNHYVTAFRIAPGTGALEQHGAPIRLPHRPIHMATDVPSEHVLVAFNNPGGIRVYQILPDGTLGSEVAQSDGIDPGVFPHQVLATPDNRLVLLIARGHDANTERGEVPGALKVFDYAAGMLSNEQSIEPNGGYGFGPRHLDFHPTRPWIYVSLERQNEVAMFERVGDALAPMPAFRANTLADPDNRRGHQLVGTVHVHPNGRFVYVANRGGSSASMTPGAVFEAGENSIAVFAIDPTTGEPTLVQNAPSHGVHPRTFHIDPTGRLMVVAHIAGMTVRDGDTVAYVPARLSLFRIGDDGTLSFARAYDIDVGDKLMWWMGMVSV